MFDTDNIEILRCAEMISLFGRLQSVLRQVVHHWVTRCIGRQQERFRMSIY